MAQLPPGNPSAEKALLGAFLKNNDLYLLNASTLEDGIFSHLPHQTIYEAMKPLFEKNHRCDLVSLIDALQDEGRIDNAGGVAYVSSLTDGVPYLENVDHFLHILKEKHLKRRLFTLANDLMGQINQESTPSEALIGDALMELSNLAQDGVRRGFVKLSEVNERFLDELEQRLRGVSSGLPLGYEDIDKRTGGLHKQNLIIIAGRPGMGKTALALNFAYRVAKEGKKVGFFSLEMSNEELYKRLICIDKNFPAQKIRDAQLSGEEKEEVLEAGSSLSNFPIFLDDSGGLSIMDVYSRARRLKETYGCDLLIIDYIQLLKASVRSSDNRTTEVSMISRGLKEMAKEFDIPVIALSQLSRAVEQRQGSNKPKLSDLRESGSIEQDADMVLFVYRPEVYFPDKEQWKGLAEIIFAKHRNGAVGSELLTFIGPSMKFANCLDPNKERWKDDLSNIGGDES
ncbi:MAG: Replicative DNA helicase [Candidatus Aminicenantes bacterium ADurb.Bin508]|nr:MAG: Replicative DNA helicase [Candidatus Aminicenantes bacterium ADurb.Bin508]HNX40932.1 replicative DNA helicase [Candidatus Aminicenantes bacterium]HPB54516.1 replicative DNA helicase [Candidatus Aminicenantes bacterium]HPS99004.1 replicative DNA helicase [Candidatus Aminicenantes bacterium]